MGWNWDLYCGRMKDPTIPRSSLPDFPSHPADQSCTKCSCLEHISETENSNGTTPIGKTNLHFLPNWGYKVLPSAIIMNLGCLCIVSFLIFFSCVFSLQCTKSFPLNVSLFQVFYLFLWCYGYNSASVIWGQLNPSTACAPGGARTSDGRIGRT